MSRFKRMKENLSEPCVKKFYVLLILTGLVPDFTDYTYFFALDVLKISKFTFGLTTVFQGVMVFFAPMVYQKFFKNTEYVEMYFYS